MMICFLHLLFFVHQSIQGHPPKSDETALLEHIRTNSSAYTRPVFNKNTPVVVNFGLEIIHLVDVKESTQSMKVKVWLRMKWKNELMTWDPKKWGGVKKTRLSPNVIWKPDIYLMEDIGSAVSSGPEEYKTQIMLYPDGTHYWLVPALLDSSCMFDVTNFPFDKQYCILKFISWTHDQTEIDIKKNPASIVTGQYVISPAWKLNNATAEIVSQKYNCCPNPYVHIEYKIALHRKPRYYFYNVVLPCIIQMLIILCTFFLPPDSGERIGVAITVLLVFAVYLEVLNESLPKTSTTAPALSRFYIAAMCGSGFSILATCFVLLIHFKGAEKGVRPMPAWVKRYILQKIGFCLCVKQNLRTHKDEDLLALSNSFLTKNKVGTINKLIKTTDVKLMKTRSEANMEKLVEEVRVITKLIDDNNLQEEIEEEWQNLAKVFDRIFFIVFLLIFVLSSLIILLPVYSQHIHGEEDEPH